MKKFWTKVKAFFSKAGNWFAQKVAENDVFVQKTVPVAVNIVNWIKEFNASTGGDAAAALINLLGNKYASTALTVVRNFITDYADKVNVGLNVVLKASETDVLAQKVEIISAYLAELTSTDERELALQNIAAMVAKALEDSRLDITEIANFVTFVYKNYLNK